MPSLFGMEYEEDLKGFGMEHLGDLKQCRMQMIPLPLHSSSQPTDVKRIRNIKTTNILRKKEGKKALIAKQIKDTSTNISAHKIQTIEKEITNFKQTIENEIIKEISNLYINNADKEQYAIETKDKIKYFLQDIQTAFTSLQEKQKEMQKNITYRCLFLHDQLHKDTFSHILTIKFCNKTHVKMPKLFS